MTPYFKDESHWQHFLPELRSWIGTPYHNMGRTKGRAADCTLFIGQAMVNCGLLPEVKEKYTSRDWYRHGTENIVMDSVHEYQSKLSGNISVLEIPGTPEIPLQGDCFLIALAKTDNPHHCAVYLGKNKIIHCSPSQGVGITWFKGFYMSKTKMTIRLMEN